MLESVWYTFCATLGVILFFLGYAVTAGASVLAIRLLLPVYLPVCFICKKRFFMRRLETDNLVFEHEYGVVREVCNKANCQFRRAILRESRIKTRLRRLD